MTASVGTSNNAVNVTKGDTTPNWFFTAWDPKGETGQTPKLLNVHEAEKIELFLKSAAGHKIHGTCVGLEHPVTDEEGVERNVEYTPGASDTSEPDTYFGQLKITWSAGKVQWVPNIGAISLIVGANEE